MENIPEVRAESQRRWSDYRFVLCDPDSEKIRTRVEYYMAEDLLGPKGTACQQTETD